jgi:hypothetical protein
LSLTEAISSLVNVYPSDLSHHHAACCREAEAWFRVVDAAWTTSVAPAWIRRRYDWGPVIWPLHWCEAIVAKHLDCGALAALAAASFSARGVPQARVQLVERFPDDNARHWSLLWKRASANVGWIFPGVVYHEACAVVSGRTIEVFDPTDNLWMPPDSLPGYGSVLAIRLHQIASGADGLFSWGSHALVPDQWNTLRPA